MSNYDNPRPSAATPYEDPCAIKDMAVTLGKLMDESGTIATYTGKQLETVTALANRFGWIDAGTFTAGVTINYKNELVKDGSGDFWQWQGAFPKVVTAGSAPSTPTWVKIIVADHSNLQGLQSGRGHAGIHPRVTTVAEIATGVFQVGDKLEVSDRDGVRFDVVAGAADGRSKLDAGAGNVAQMDATLTSVSYKDFGAVLDGIANDSDAVLAAHVFCNTHGIKLSQRGGVARVDGLATVLLNTDCDFSGGFYFLVNTQPTSYIFDVGIGNDYTKTVLNQADITISEFKKYANVIPSLSAYRYMYATIESTEVDLVRTTGQNQLKKSVTVIGEDGKLIYPLTCTFNSISTITLSPVNTSTRTISGFSFKVDGAVTTVLPVKISRNNTVLNSVRFIDGATSASIPVRQLFTIDAAYNTSFNGLKGDELSRGKLDFNYVINSDLSAKIKVSNMEAFEGWAQLDGNYTRDVIVEDSTFDRVGGHFGCYDYTIRRVRTNGPQCVDIAGGGRLDISDVVMSPTALASGANAVCILREDYGCEWDGSISIKGVTIDARALTVAGTFYAVNSYLSSAAAAWDFGRDLELARTIDIDDVTLLLNPASTSKMELQSVRLGAGAAALGGSRKINYPRRISVDDVSIGSSNISVNNEVNSVYLLGSVPAKSVNSSMDISINKVNRADPRFSGLNPYDVGQSVSFTVPLISNLTVTMTVDNCKWLRGDFSSTGYCEISKSSIAAISGSGRYELNDCQYYGSSFSGTWKAAVMGGVIRAYQATDTTFKQIGFPNNIEVNIKACKNLFVEVNGAVRSITQTTSTVQTGFIDAAFYIAP